LLFFTGFFVIVSCHLRETSTHFLESSSHLVESSSHLVEIQQPSSRILVDIALEWNDVVTDFSLLIDSRLRFGRHVTKICLLRKDSNPIYLSVGRVHSLSKAIFDFFCTFSDILKKLSKFFLSFSQKLFSTFS
jgi:hypothetical protein